MSQGGCSLAVVARSPRCAVAASSALARARAPSILPTVAAPGHARRDRDVHLRAALRAREGEVENDQGYFAWLNRLNAVLGWKKLTLGVRIDSSLYALRPEDRDLDEPVS